MNRTAVTIFCFLSLGASFPTRATDFPHGASPLSGPEEWSMGIRQNEFSITCPDRVAYQAQPVAGWNSGMNGVKQFYFTDAAVTGRILYCNYEAANGGASTLMREAPAGYVCTTDARPGFKNWQFLCKRAVAPIKIKPKSE